MKKTILKNNSSFILFVSPKIEVALENGPTLRANTQIIIAKDENNEWCWDDMEILDIKEVVFMGTTITDPDKINKLVDHFNNMGLSLYDVLYEEMQEILDMSTSIEEFVFNQTGVVLPKKG